MTECSRLANSHFAGEKPDAAFQHKLVEFVAELLELGIEQQVTGLDGFTEGRPHQAVKLSVAAHDDTSGRPPARAWRRAPR